MWIAVPLSDDFFKSAFYSTGNDGESASGSEEDTVDISIIFDWIDQNDGERLLVKIDHLQHFDFNQWS